MIAEATRTASEEPRELLDLLRIFWDYLEPRMFKTFRDMPYQPPEPSVKLWVAGWQHDRDRGLVTQLICRPLKSSDGEIEKVHGRYETIAQADPSEAALQPVMKLRARV